jgi:hypothetical protein
MDVNQRAAMGANAFILVVATPDGFEVAFALAASQADVLGKTLRGCTASVAAQQSVVN